MSLLSDKVVLVSGGTQGVGAGVARAAARAGAAVAVTGRRREPGEALAAELVAAGAAARFVQADVADVAKAQGSVTAVVAELGRVDCLVNAAGLTARGTLLDTTPELFDAHIAVNLRAPFFLMQAAVKDMLARGGGGGGGGARSSPDLRSAGRPARSSTSSPPPSWAASRTWRRTWPPRPAWPA
jgi:NAD(P)-dependent dehydrogenase (short-subunit alcohol dehydrogenase family)